MWTDYLLCFMYSSFAIKFHMTETKNNIYSDFTRTSQKISYDWNKKQYTFWFYTDKFASLKWIYSMTELVQAIGGTGCCW